MADLENEKKMNGPLLQQKGQDPYVPIGKYIYLCKDEKLYELPDPVQWAGQVLITSLATISDIGGITKGELMSTATEVGAKIKADHSIEGYKVDIMDSLFGETRLHRA